MHYRHGRKERPAACRHGGGGATPPVWTRTTPPPPCDIPSGCCFSTGPWTVTRSSLRMLRWVAAFCRPLRPVLLLASFLRSRSPVVGVPPPPPVTVGRSPPLPGGLGWGGLDSPDLKRADPRNRRKERGSSGSGAIIGIVRARTPPSRGRPLCVPHSSQMHWSSASCHCTQSPAPGRLADARCLALDGRGRCPRNTQAFILTGPGQDPPKGHQGCPWRGPQWSCWAPQGTAPPPPPPGGGVGGMKQRIQISHIPPCHRHMVIATTPSVHCFALVYRRVNQAEPPGGGGGGGD